MNDQPTAEERLEFLKSQSIQELQKLLPQHKPQRGLRPNTYKRTLILDIIDRDNKARRALNIVKDISNRKSNQYIMKHDLHLWADLRHE